MQIKCPRCGQEHLYDKANPYRPFCSERCKMIDMGKWLQEDYRVPATFGDEDEMASSPDASSDLKKHP